MRKIINPMLERGRLTHGPFATDASDGHIGCFLFLRNDVKIKIIASDGNDEYKWEHVSISTPTRCPTWEEMCWVKDLFWNEEECVLQFHPPKSDYVNNHPYCLHLWKPVGLEIPRPPSIMVGHK